VKYGQDYHLVAINVKLVDNDVGSFYQFARTRLNARSPHFRKAGLCKLADLGSYSPNNVSGSLGGYPGQSNRKFGRDPRRRGRGRRSSYTEPAETMVELLEREDFRVFLSPAPAHFRSLIFRQLQAASVLFFDQFEDRYGVLLPLRRPGQNAIKHSANLLFGHRYSLPHPATRSISLRKLGLRLPPRGPCRIIATVGPSRGPSLEPRPEREAH
jgi:hypothetical protein